MTPGQVFSNCSANYDLFDIDIKDLITECSGTVGVTRLNEQVVSERMRVLSC